MDDATLLDTSGGAGLPEDHLALVIEDALTAVDGANGQPQPVESPDLRAVLLYSWSWGALSTQDVIDFSVSDPGLQYLLRGSGVAAGALRAYRERNRERLQSTLGAALEVCRAAGLSQLGGVRLEVAPGRDGADSMVDLATALVLQSATADQLADAINAPVPLPDELQSRGAREGVFRDVARGIRPAQPPTVSAPAPPVETAKAAPVQVAAEPPVGESAVLDTTRSPMIILSRVLSILAALAVLVVGLVTVRWVAASSAPPPARTTAARPPTLVPFAEVGELTVTPTPTVGISFDDDVDLAAAYGEAIRLADESLQTDDLAGARDFYFLATQVYPDDALANDRLRQVQTAVGIDDRRTDWDEALEDLADLREVVPDSRSVLRAYVTALVTVGREALDRDNPIRARALCGEANRWLPDRADARSCVIAAGGVPFAVGAQPSTPTRGPVGVPTSATPTSTLR
jgi:hypothetical protein